MFGAAGSAGGTRTLGSAAGSWAAGAGRETFAAVLGAFGELEHELRMTSTSAR